MRRQGLVRIRARLGQARMMMVPAQTVAKRPTLHTVSRSYKARLRNVQYFTMGGWYKKVVSQVLAPRDRAC